VVDGRLDEFVIVNLAIAVEIALLHDVVDHLLVIFRRLRVS